MMLNVMLDLETYGTRPGCVLRSIGAVAFDPLGKITGAEFYRNIDYVSCLEAGLIVDTATKEWWSRQSREAEAALLIDPRALSEVVKEFHQWFLWEARAEQIWSHGANFDEPLWLAAAHAVGTMVPWKFWNVRCTRTLFEIVQFDPRSILRQGMHHNALDDAKHQARCVQFAMQNIRTKAPA
jgi:hypothetical protein